jgi:hypothetical protein
MSRTELHRHLCTLLLQVERDKDIRPVLRLVESLNSSAKVRLDIVEWVQQFSPFKFRERADGNLSAQLSKNKKFNLATAQNTPFWIADQLKRVALRDEVTPTAIPNLKKSAEQRLQVQSQRAIMMAVREFFASPDVRQIANVIEQLEQYKRFSVTLAGVDREARSRLPYVSVVQGGLPSLGKKAK